MSDQVRLSDAEWTVMNAVWEQSPCTAREVLARCSADWAYSTVRTLLDRLIEKGALRARRDGRLSVYEPRLSREQARRSAVRSLLDRAFDGAFGSLMQHLVAAEKLSAADRRKLRQMLDDEARR